MDERKSQEFFVLFVMLLMAVIPILIIIFLPEVLLIGIGVIFIICLIGFLLNKK